MSVGVVETSGLVNKRASFHAVTSPHTGSRRNDAAGQALLRALNEHAAEEVAAALAAQVLPSQHDR